MRFNFNCDIRNEFTIVRENIETHEKKEYKAYNILLNQIYTRLCNYQPYFTHIHFGTGTGAFDDHARTSLYTYLGNRSAVTEFQTVSYPTSQWRRKITLLPEQYVGAEITEIGVAYGASASNAVTHAAIKDAEGNPIILGPKKDNEAITIYADFYVTIYSPDHGLRFYADGLRSYLLGASMASDSVSIGFYGADEDGFAKPSTRTIDVPNRRVTTYVRFQGTEYNSDIRIVDWINIGARVELPRAGVFTGKLREAYALGAGDGVKTVFPIPFKEATAQKVYVEGIESADWDYANAGTAIEFTAPPADGLPITADLQCKYPPKDATNVFDATFGLTYGISELPPVVSPPDFSQPPYSLVPGSAIPIAGDSAYGFWGEVATLITGADLCTQIGLTQGTLQHSTEPWLKFTLNGKMLLVAKKTFRHTVSWDDINAVGAVWGEKIIEIGSVKYRVRLLSTREWNDLMYPIHVDHPSGAPNWAEYTDQDLLVHSSFGNGSYSWTQTKSGENRINRGYIGVTNSTSNTPSAMNYYLSFRPVLETL